MKLPTYYKTPIDYTCAINTALAAGWKLRLLSVGVVYRYGSNIDIEAVIRDETRVGNECLTIIGPSVSTQRQYAVMTRPAEQPVKHCLPVPDDGDTLFIYTDSRGRKVPVFAQTAEDADKKAGESGMAELTCYQAFALADVTGLLQ